MMNCEKFKTIWDNLQIRSGAEATAAALFSVPVTCLMSWLISRFYAKRLPVYSEFSAGGTVYDGYNKQGDMCFFYLLIFLLPILFMGFLFVKHLKRPGKSYVNQIADADWKVRRKNRQKRMETVAVPLVLGCSAIWAVSTAFTGYRMGKSSLWLWLIPAVCWVIFVIALAYVSKRRKKDLTVFEEWTSAFFQLLLPVVFLGYSRFYYDYEMESSPIELYHSAKWRGFCFLTAFVLFLWQCMRIYKKKKGVSLCSLAIISIMVTAVQPEGILSVDFFHNGEMALPMQQLLSYGRLPYFDLDPIHGFCDFVYSFFNYVFFDGSYFSQNAAIMVSQMFAAAVLAALVGYFTHGDALKLSYIIVFMPFLVEKAGIRYVAFFAAFLILLSDKVRKNSHHFLWWWAVLSMVGIAFHVSIGASLAVAFLPEALYRFVRDVIPDMKVFVSKKAGEKRNLIFLYGSLLILGIAYIPLFIQILRYLKENAGTTLWVNGTGVFLEEFKPIETFTFFAVYLMLLILALRKSQKGRAAFVSMACCLTVIINYSCVRYDEGLRLAVLGVFFGFLFFVYLYDESVYCRIPYVFHILILALCLYISYGASSYGDFGTEYIPAEKDVEIQEKLISDPIVYVSGDSVGMPNLGTGFIQGLTLNSLKNIQTVLEAEQAWDSWLDLTNKISHAVIFDSEVKYPFTSAYNISNDLLQEKMIESLQKEKPHLILLSPYIRFDQAPIGIRSPKLYQALLAMGYRPYAYEDVIYLLDGESVFAEAAAGERRLGNLNHRTDLGMLPYLWGSAADERKKLKEIKADYHSLDGAEVFYMEIVADASALTKASFTLEFQSDVDGEFYKFTVETGMEKLQGKECELHYMIPLGSSPFFGYSKDVDIEISGIEIKELHYYR